MELKRDDWVKTESGEVGKVVHISRLTIFVAHLVPCKRGPYWGVSREPAYEDCRDRAIKQRQHEKARHEGRAVEFHGVARRRGANRLDHGSSLSSRGRFLNR